METITDATSVSSSVQSEAVEQEYKNENETETESSQYVKHSMSTIEHSIETRPSYLSLIDHIDDYLLNKVKERANIVNKQRKSFGMYEDCMGVVRKPIYISECEKGVLSLRYSPNGKRLVSGFGSGTINLYDAVTYELRNTIVYGKENGYPITCIRFLMDNNNVFYASSGEGFVLSYNVMNDDLCVVVKQADSEINAIDINCNNTCLLTGASNHGVKLYDLSTSLLLSSYRNRRTSGGKYEYKFPEFHSNRVFAVKFLPDDPNIFLSGGWDNTLKMWDLRTKFGCVKTVIGPHITGDAIDVRGNLLLTGSWEAKNCINVRDLRTFNVLHNVLPTNVPKISEGVYTYSVRFFDRDTTGDVILHVSLGYKSLDVISISQNVILHSFISQKSCVSIDTHEANTVFGGTDNSFHFVVFFMNLLVSPNQRPRFDVENDSGEMKEDTVDDESEEND